ncbi:MAG: hypothetical protein KatS3mg090_0798 [Patescibacteria group bacterium]|nr:MAG: hypothetical protein KatS3mg090_0798 [Patescibacteria group bacterium]
MFLKIANTKIIKIMSVLISLVIAIFYFFYINLPTDSIILFLPNKLFLGLWLKKGIFPLYNPYIFTGIPFAFDIGLGNLHPFNLFFLSPYPLSISIWVFFTTLIFSYGFLKFFMNLTKSLKWSFLFFGIILFSGQGVFIRMNNPTMWAVISHWGMILYALKDIQKSNYLKPVFWSVLMVLSGHFQMAVFGLFLILLIAQYIYNIPFKKILLFNLLLAIFLLPYILLAIPIIIESTRLTNSTEYTKLASLNPIQLTQIILPFIFGNIREGANWAVGQVEVITTSILVLPFLIILLFKRKIETSLIFVLLICYILSFGLIQIPFLRNMQQMYSVIFFILVAKIAQNLSVINKELSLILTQKKKIMLLMVILSSLTLFVYLFFDNLSIYLLKILNKYPHAFYDLATINSIKMLIVRSLIIWIFLLLVVLFLNQNIWLGIFLFVLVEGLTYTYYHNLFIPQSIIEDSILNISYLNKLDKNKNFRIQSILDVYPYTGIHSYMPGVLKRPPFSKEKDFFINELNNNYELLRHIFWGVPSNWNIIYSVSSVQGYATFVPKNLAEYFNNPSVDYKEKYSNLIAKNPFLGGEDKGFHTNYIETSKITFSDQRWSNLAVKYIISPFELKSYNNLILDKRIQNLFIYRIKETKAIYSIKIGNKTIYPEIIKKTPNKTILKLPKKLRSGAVLEVLEQPGGKIIKTDGQQLTKNIQNYSYFVKLEPGFKTIEIYYSPILHLYEIINKILNNN